MMKYLFKVWPTVLTQLLKAEQVLLLLDYDGTITSIAATPDKAILAEGMRRLLKSLAEKARFRLGIISGRQLAEIQGIIGVTGIYYAGNHGLEMEGPELYYTHPGASQARPYLTRILQALNEGLAQIEGVILEDKGLSLSLHYRLVGNGCILKLRRVFNQVCQPYVSQGQVSITEGKKVLEVRPRVDWNKGMAALRLRDMAGGVSAPLMIYIGDDRTDEDAFSVLRAGEDISVLVGDSNQASCAKYYLLDVPEVREFLLRLAELP